VGTGINEKQSNQDERRTKEILQEASLESIKTTKDAES
jgi:hypothetical protein